MRSTDQLTGWPVSTYRCQGRRILKLRQGTDAAATYLGIGHDKSASLRQNPGGHDICLASVSKVGKPCNDMTCSRSKLLGSEPGNWYPFAVMPPQGLARERQAVGGNFRR